MRSFAAERAVALGEIDPFEFFLCEKLGKLPHELDSMPYADWVRLAAFYKWKNAVRAMLEQRAKNLGAG